jgi:hypothetical protein
MNVSALSRVHITGLPTRGISLRLRDVLLDASDIEQHKGNEETLLKCIQDGEILDPVPSLSIQRHRDFSYYNSLSRASGL